MNWFHGTSSEHRESILSQGLLPRGTSPGTWSLDYHAPSIADSVYLTNAWAKALWYAARTALLYPGSQGLIVTVQDLRPDQCAPDEDVFTRPNEYITKEQVLANQHRLHTTSMTWEDCVARCGLVRHIGPITTAHIVELREIPLIHNPWSFLCEGTVEDFDWAMTIIEYVFQHYQLSGFYGDRLYEYRVKSLSPDRYLVTVPDRDPIVVTR